MKVDLREGNYLHLLRRQIEKDGLNIEHRLSRTNSTIIADIDQDYNVKSWHWKEYEFKQEEAPIEVEEKKSLSNEKIIECNYCGRLKTNNSMATCGAKICKDKHKDVMIVVQRRKQALQRYTVRFDNAGLDHTKVNIVAHYWGENGAIADDYTRMMRYVRELINTKYDFLFIPDWLFRKNQNYFNNLKNVSIIVGTSTYRATNKTYMRNRKVKAVSSFIGMLQAIALKHNNKPVKVIMLVDNKTQLFMQSLAAEVNIHKTHRSTLQVKKNTLKQFYKESKNLLKRVDL